MSDSEVTHFYQQHIAPLSEPDRLQLASIILGGISNPAESADDNAADDALLARQKQALQSMCGMFHGGDPEASVKHDEILYGPAHS